MPIDTQLATERRRGPAPKVYTPEETAARAAEKKAAKATYDREFRAKNAEKIKAAKAAWGKTDTKKAYDKKWAEENREHSNAIKKAWKERNPEHHAEYYARNREEILAGATEYYAANSDVIRAKSAAWRAANPEQAKAAYTRCYTARKDDYIAKAKAWKEANLERSRELARAAAARNPLKLKVRRAKYRHRVREATPIWADKGDIADVYKEASHTQLHVDHVIPLRHPRVCGLHVWNNLQLLTPSQNSRKSNKYDVEVAHAH